MHCACYRCSVPSAPPCDDDECRRWHGGRWSPREAPPTSLPAWQDSHGGDGYAPWAWDERRRLFHSLWAVGNKPLALPRAMTRADYDVSVKFFATAKRVLLTRAAAAPVQPGQAPPHPLPNESWVEIFRTRTTSKWYQEKGVAEGVDYGCWAYPLLPPFTRGTGIFVHTGRSLDVADRVQAGRMFEHARQRFHARSRDRTSQHRPAPRSRSKLSSKELAADDAHWAHAAHEMGYDTVQIRSGPDGMPEMLISSLPCLSQRAPIGACLPVPLRTGEGASKQCRCSETGSPVHINCDG